MNRKEKRGPVAEIGQSGYYARITKQRGGYLVEFLISPDASPRAGRFRKRSITGEKRCRAGSS